MFVSDFNPSVKRSAINKKKKKEKRVKKKSLPAFVKNSGHSAGVICKHITQREDMEVGGLGGDKLL